MTGSAFCSLFVLSLIACSLGVLWFGDGWHTQEPLTVAANISGVSFATAIAAISIGGIVMVIPKIPRIFRWKSLEEGREEGERIGRQQVMDAAAEEIPEEALERIKERLREQERS